MWIIISLWAIKLRLPSLFRNFGPLNYTVKLNGITFVIISALTLEDQETPPELVKQTRDFIQSLDAKGTHPISPFHGMYWPSEFTHSLFRDRSCCPSHTCSSVASWRNEMRNIECVWTTHWSRWIFLHQSTTQVNIDKRCGLMLVADHLICFRFLKQINIQSTAREDQTYSRLQRGQSRSLSLRSSPRISRGRDPPKTTVKPLCSSLFCSIL